MRTHAADSCRRNEAVSLCGGSSNPTSQEAALSFSALALTLPLTLAGEAGCSLPAANTPVTSFSKVSQKSAARRSL